MHRYRRLDGVRHHLHLSGEDDRSDALSHVFDHVRLVCMTKRQIAALLKSRRAFGSTLGVGIGRAARTGSALTADVSRRGHRSRPVEVSVLCQMLRPRRRDVTLLGTRPAVSDPRHDGGDSPDPATRGHLYVAGPYGMGMRYQQDPTHCNPSSRRRGTTGIASGGPL